MNLNISIASVATVTGLDRDSKEYQIVSEMAAQITAAAMARPGRSWMRALRSSSGLRAKALTLLLRWRCASRGVRAFRPLPDRRSPAPPPLRDLSPIRRARRHHHRARIARWL